MEGANGRSNDLHVVQKWNQDVGHIQTECAEVHDAHDKAHNDCWKAVSEIIEAELQHRIRNQQEATSKAELI